MDARRKATVRRRAGFRCEYCHLPERVAELPLQFDHIVAEQHGGPATLENLALACARCNRFKGPNLSGVDPETGVLTRLFNPRADSWKEHFAWDGARVRGRTTIGRATVHVLQMNHPAAVNQRRHLLNEGIDF
ncbi:MAG: HNH endonuclease [Verrucomicrobia bacterium]|nr:HNH endonuclease [Verrucomicrobiota bacterium]